MKKVRVIRFLVTISCLIGGALAGNNIYRYTIEVPAWRHLSIETWEKYSEHADLGNGLVLFPVEAIGSAIPLIIVSIISLRSTEFKSASLLLHISTLFAIIGLVFTFFAAPVMLNLPNIKGDSGLLQQAFNKFHFWGMLRAIAQVLSFVFCVMTLSNLRNTDFNK